MPSRRHEAAAFNPLASICAATCPAFSSAASRDSMANTALSAPAAHVICLWLTLESTLRMKCTMHRWYLASGSMVVPEKLRKCGSARPWRGDQFASMSLSLSRDMSR